MFHSTVQKDMKTEIRIMCKRSKDSAKISGFFIDFSPESWFLLNNDDIGKIFSFRTQNSLSELYVRYNVYQLPSSIKVGIEILVKEISEKTFHAVFCKYVRFYIE